MHNKSLDDEYFNAKGNVAINETINPDDFNEEAAQQKKSKKLQRKKSLRSKVRGLKKKLGEGISRFVWGDHSDRYNYVRETTFWINFAGMQFFRMLSLITLFSIWCVYFYIYVRSAFFNYNFIALTLTLIAFFCLFIGSGKQVVYQ